MNTNSREIVNCSYVPKDVVCLPQGGCALEEINRIAIIQALEMADGVQVRAAKLLSLSPRVLNYKIKTLGIAWRRTKKDE